MQHPTQSPIDPADLPPVGEVPPVMVAVPAQARTVMSEAGIDLDRFDSALVQARLEELVETLKSVAVSFERAGAELTRILAAAEQDR